jgi:hypothetical protein
MPALPLLFVGLLIAGSLEGAARATGCRGCAFGGLCFPDDGGAPVSCTPEEAGCVPYGGVLTFNSVPPPAPVYWALFARRGNVAGRLVGKLSAFADRGLTQPDVPGFPWRCFKDVCFARKGQFVGTVVGDRFTGIARYRRGETCEFDATLAFGLGSPVPNIWVCRNAAGTVTSQGPLQLQGIRITGCAR